MDIRGLTKHIIPATACALAVAGCSKQPATPVEAAVAPAYDTSMPMNEVMNFSQSIRTFCNMPRVSPLRWSSNTW